MYELLTNSEMARADALTIASGTPGVVLMESAGRAVADEAVKMVSPGSRIGIVCGPGNNGGDGFVAARHLSQRGFIVTLGLLGEADALKGDARAMYERWAGETKPAAELNLSGADLIIDALFGSGLTRKLDGPARITIERVNLSGKPILAVDIPSGVDGSTGEVLGDPVMATRTVTFFRAKPGHHLLPGRSFCGTLHVANIGIPGSVLEQIGTTLGENDLGAWRASFPVPTMSGHKYKRGHAVVVSGPPLATGAARLGARGALRIGAGLVTLFGSPASSAINAAHVTAVMVHSGGNARSLEDFLADHRRNAVLIGPGASVGRDTAESVIAILKTGAATVLDADALTSFSDEPAKAGAEPGGFGFLRSEAANSYTRENLCNAIAAMPVRPVVMTPHDGEFQRLFGSIDGSKVERAREAARRSGAIVVLKGPDTVIASPQGKAAINTNAPPALATAGSGDVLAGFIAGLLAQHMPAFEAACAAVWLHGACAAEFGPGLIAEDIPEALPAVLCKFGLYERL